MSFRRERDIDLSISPLLPSVPLSGSDKALGLHEINALLRITPPEAEDELVSSPLLRRSPISSLSLSELQEQAQQKCCWVTFAHATMLTPLSSVYSVPGSVPALVQRVNSNLLEFLNCYWVLFQVSALIWAYAFPKSLLGLASCIVSYFLVLLSIHVTRMAMSRWHLHGLIPAPTAGLILKRNIFLAFVVQFCLLSVVGWSGLQLFLMWLVASCSGLLFHAAMRRPSWQIRMLHTHGSRSSFAQGVLEGAAKLGVGYSSKDMASQAPPEGLKPLAVDCWVRSCRLLRRRWRYFRGWAEDVAYVWQYALSRWWDALQQRRRRRRVLRILVSHARQTKRKAALDFNAHTKVRWPKRPSKLDDDHLYL